MDTDKDELTIALVDTRVNLNLYRGKNGSAAFLPFSQKIGGNDGEMQEMLITVLLEV